MNFTEYAVSSEAPGAVGVPGGLVMSHNGGPGLNQSRSIFGAREGEGGQRPLAGSGNFNRGEAFNGEDLLYTTDGREWKLLKRLWPQLGSYSTLAELETDSDGAALTYGTLFAGGFLGPGEYMVFMNFSWNNLTSNQQ
jgi:hypothetical protein